MDGREGEQHPSLEWPDWLPRRPKDGGDGPEPDPQPQPRPPIPPFQPSDYTIDLLSFFSSVLRGRGHDRLWGVSATRSPNNTAVADPVLFGDVHSGQRVTTQLSTGKVRLSKPEDVITFAFALWNTGQPENVAVPPLRAAASELLDQANAVAAHETALARAFLPGLTFGGEPDSDNGSHTIDIGVWIEALIAFNQWLFGQVIFPDCDGPVAAGTVRFTGQRLWNGLHVVRGWGEENPHPGGPSADGCGARSLYITAWVVRMA